ncbi:MAG TPA: sigma-70 family RNA polymerase sigma factor [Ignavibacteria bacterium]|nr:sigma-70 family RNA polymerase sigma factor [Ignavibacteria bacterium]
MYDKYSAFLYGIIVRIVHSEETAEDVMQEVFVKIWKNIGSFDPEKAKLVTWIGNIARNLAIDKIRSKEYKNSLQNHDIEDYVNIIEESPSSAFNPEHIGVKEMLEKLTPEHRVLIDMVYFQGYTQAEVSVKLGIPLGTVKTRIRSALINLRNIYT